MTITKRQALGTLTKTRLLDVADEIGLTGLSRKKKDEVVEALASSRAAKLSDLLALYSRNELKSACEAAGLSTKGREKAVIVDRLLGNGHADSEAEPAPEKTKAKAVTKAMSKRSIRHYDHPDKKRPNNPPVGLVTPDTDPPVPTKKTYAYDPHVDPALQFSNAGAKVDRILDEGLAAENLDVAKRALQELRRHREPYLAWAGKAERTSFELDTVSLHVHERIDPKTLIDFVRAHNGDLHTEQLGLFDQPHENLPLREAVDFYRHEHNWSNRLIAGDSLLVMNSLLEKEGLGGKVQMVYLDPPYGISYGSNFQPFVGRREVKDRKDADLTREPEVLRAFRDTWELNIHSYLAALRDRLLLARDLLAATGSCFVQISSENVHRVTLLLDEIFGRENFVELIAFRKKTMPLGGRLLEGVCDYIVWYAKDKEQVKYRGLFTPSTVEGDSHWNIALEPGRPPRKMTRSEIDDHSQLPPNTDVAQLISLYPTGSFSTGIYSFEYEGKTYSPPPNRSWKTPIEGMRRLALAKRLVPYKGGDTLRYLLKASDYPVSPLSNVWADTSAASDMDFVVQTSTKVLARCLLMSTDPGDLVLDPTCGSGTTAVVAEKYGRRWITTDTSRVAITIARQRLMTSVFPYYKLRYGSSGVTGGFLYKTVPHITLKSIANNASIREGMAAASIKEAVDTGAAPEDLYDSPLEDRSIVRVAGPFTVESVPASVVVPIDDAGQPGPEQDCSGRSGETLRQSEWRDELLKAGIRGKGGQVLRFSRVEPLAGATYLHAEAEVSSRDSTSAFAGQRAAVCFGPEHAPMEQRLVELAWEEARSIKPRPGILLFVAFSFDPEAAKDIDELDPGKAGMKFMRVEMNDDLATQDLKKKRSTSESFWLIGQPDISVRCLTKGEDKGKVEVEVHGFDYFDLKKGQVVSGGAERIAVWLLDTDYDGRSLYPRQVFFPMAGEKKGWSKLAKSLQAEIDVEKIAAFRGSHSLPFEPGKWRRIAVKLVDDRGIESLVIRNLDEVLKG